MHPPCVAATSPPSCTLKGSTGLGQRTSSAVDRSTRMDMPSARLWYLPLMWSRYEAESRRMQSHTLQ